MNAERHGNSRAKLVRPALRPAMPARLMLSGPAGSGKTWTGLDIARVLVGPDGQIIVIDTETESALLYADEHAFMHLPWAPPYDPRDLAATILDLGTDTSVCIMIDSLTHFWQGEGGTLDIADSKFGGWKEATPAQDEMVAAMLRCKAHVIGCVREKQAYSVTESQDGGRKKQTVAKLGLQPVQREGLDYEFNVTASMDMQHALVIAKTRCRVLAGKSFRPNHAGEMAEQYRDWLAGGQVMVPEDEREAFIERVLALPKTPYRAMFLEEFRDRFGSTDQMLAQDLPEAIELLVQFEDAAKDDPTTSEPPAADTAPPAVEPPVDTSAQAATALDGAPVHGPLADALASVSGEPESDAS